MTMYNHKKQSPVSGHYRVTEAEHAWLLRDPENGLPQSILG